MNDEFARALSGLREMGASPDTEELVERLARHGREEGELLAEYEELVQQAASPAVRYLVGLVMEDERRHHRTLVEIAEAAAWGHFAGTPDDATPNVDRADAGNAALLDVTSRLIEHEDADHEELARLRKALRPYADTTLWALLVDTMISDTDKHRRILRFVKEHLLTAV